MFLTDQSFKEHLPVIFAAVVALMSAVFGVVALMAGAVALAIFFGVVLLQAWGYLIFIAVVRLVPVFRAFRSLW